MKKLMFIASALLCGAALATLDPASTSLTSGVVGYNQKGLVQGKQYVTASFFGVGTNTFWVSDLKVVGYQNDPQYVENWGYGASFFIVDTYGRCLNEMGKSFGYGDNLNSDDPIEWAGGIWLDANGDEVVPHGANDLELVAGSAIYWEGQDFTEGYEQSIQTSGSVLADDCAVRVVQGKNAVGNPTAAPVWLTDVLVQGYQEDPYYVENWGYGASFFIVDPYGRCLNEMGKSFGYGDNLVSDDPIEWTGGVWLDANGDEVVPKSANDLLIQPGEAIYWEGQDFTAGYPQTLVWPTALK